MTTIQKILHSSLAVLLIHFFSAGMLTFSSPNASTLVPSVTSAPAPTVSVIATSPAPVIQAVAPTVQITPSLIQQIITLLAEIATAVGTLWSIFKKPVPPKPVSS